MKQRQIIILGSAVLILLAGYGGCSLLAGLKKAPERKAVGVAKRLVKTLTVKHDTISLRTEFQGKLIASEKVEVFPEVTGRLLENPKAFRVGQSFSKGEVMLAMDGRESMLNLQSQRSNFMNVITQILPDIKIDHSGDFAEWKAYLASLDPAKTLPELPAVSNDQLKSFLSGRNVYQVYFSIKSLEDRQSKFTIVAPFDGVVTMGYLNAGTVLRAGQKVGEFMRINTYEMEGAVATQDIGKVSLGSDVILSHPLKSDPISGSVTRIAGNVDPNTQRVSVYATVQGSDLKEGMYLSGYIASIQVSDAFELNHNLILDGNRVFVLEDSLLQLRSVQVKDRFGEQAIVTGLEEGTLVLDQVIEGAFEGMLVEPEVK